MTGYIIRRLIAAFFTLWLVVTLVFLMVQSLPGDVVLTKLGEGGRLSERQMEAARRELGLDKPIYEKYFIWLGGVLRGDLGNSLLYDDQSVAGRIQKALPPTIELAIMASVVTIIIAVPIGVLSAVKQDSAIDQVARLFAVSGLAMPQFWPAILLLIYLAILLDYSPPFGHVYFWENPSRNLEMFYIPALLLGHRLAATVMRITRSSVLEVLRLDYVRTARAKGLRERVVIVRHVLANSLIPVVTLFGNQFTFLLGGSLIIEVIFSIPGLGLLSYQAIQTRDYTQIMGNVLFFGVIVLGMNLLVDISYGYLDPRIRYR